MRLMVGVLYLSAAVACGRSPVAAERSGPDVPLLETSQLGDADGFNVRVFEGDRWLVAWDHGFLPGPTAGDPPFTDRFVGAEPVIYTHVVRASPAVIVSATLKLMTMCIQDADTFFDGTPMGYDIRLFVDSVEVSGAFDSVDQMEDSYCIAGAVTFPLAADILPRLNDGNAQIRLEANRVGQSSTLWAIDYSQLIVAR